MENTKAIGKKGLYLYCFFKGPSSLPTEMGIDGKNNTFVLSYKALCALVSPVSLDEYNEDVLNQRLNDLKWLTSKIKRHEEIIRYVTGICPVMPVKFGAIYTSSERVLEILRNGYDKFNSFLEFVQDKEEWGIKVYVDEKACGETIEGKNYTLREATEGASSARSGEAYFFRKKRERVIQQEVFCLLDNLADELYQQMESWSVDGRINKLLSKEATGRQEEMFLNAAFLLKKTEVELFKQRVDDMAASHASYGLLFEFSGPWPPYNFCPNFEASKGVEEL